MRIISGTSRGKKLKSFNLEHIRPTTDRTKESLFNIIGPRIIDATFLDCFAGSGSIALEAKSRKAAHVIAVDNNQASCTLIKENCMLTDLPITVLKMDVITFLKNNIEIFDFIYCDPPYDIDLVFIKSLCEVIFDCNSLKPTGTLFIEVRKNFAIDELIFNSLAVKSRKYGQSKILEIKFML